jgi:nitrite reductase (NADH) large subunit
MHYVIIGNGVAGVSAAEAIRENDTRGEITLIGDETFSPYCRPMISMVLEGSLSQDRLPIRSRRFYDTLGIHPMLGDRVTALDANRSCLTVAGGKTVSYDRLLIATGADPRPIRAEGLFLKHIFYMRTQDHVRQMLAVLPGVSHALVLGGGLVGFKAAYGLLHRGIDVTMLIGSGVPLSMQVDDGAGAMVLDELMRHGLHVQVQQKVVAFEGNGCVQRAHLSDGSSLACDMVVIGKGVLPALSFVPRDQIQVDLGIVVNDFMQTTAPAVYAAGDVAESIDVARKAPWVNAIWPEAVIQGRMAGMNMAGCPVAYRGSLGRNVIRIFGMDVMSAGVVNAPDEPGYETMIEADSRNHTYRKLVFRSDRLVGMVLVNAIEQGGLLVALIQNEIPIAVEKARLLEPGLNYRTLINN